MTYFQILDIIMYSIYGIYILLGGYMFVFGVIGLFAHRKYPETKELNSYGIIIPARNEGKVIGNLIESLRNTNYPNDKLKIYVIAHNCTDDTASVARSLGATVYEYNNDNERTKGYALKYIFDEIRHEDGIESKDGYFIFDADNLVPENFFNKMNDAFNYYNKENIILSFRNSKNFGKSIISGIYGIYFFTVCLFGFRGRSICKCSGRSTGTGYVIPAKYLKSGWNYLTITEDLELSVDQIIEGNKLEYCDEAIIYDEQPTSVGVMWRQRVRWARGLLLIFAQREHDIIRNLFKKKTKRKGSLYDIGIQIVPWSLIFAALTVIMFIGYLCAPLIMKDTTLYDIFISDNHNLLTSRGWVFNNIRMLIISYVGIVFVGILIMILMRKRLRHVSFLRKIAILLVWPVFLGLQVFIDLQALFSKNLPWKVIPHKDDTSHIEIKNSGNE